MAVMEVERKVTKIGNSLGVTLPPEVLKHIGVKQGDEISFQLEKDGTVSVKKNTNSSFVGLEGIDEEFLDGMKELFDNYDNTLRNLADR